MVAAFSDFAYTFCSANLREVTLFVTFMTFRSSGWAVRILGLARDYGHIYRIRAGYLSQVR